MPNTGWAAPGKAESAVSRTIRAQRVTVFAPRIEALLREHLGSDVFRLEPETVGIAGAGLMDEVMRARPAGPDERPTFKPVRGKPIDRTEAATYMRAVGADVRRALKAVADGETPAAELIGRWPGVPHDYLRDLVFGSERFRFRVLVDRRLELTPKLTWSAVVASSAMLGRPGHQHPDRPPSNLAALVFEAETYAERRHAMYLYRRVAAPVCFTVASLVTNALWLGAPFDAADSNRNILLEALRLLPPSWNILRSASPEFPSLESTVGPSDDLLLLPLLSHRDPRLWEEPEAFRPERWDALDPDDHPGYLPFGHASERCWGRHMVMPLAEHLLEIVRRENLTVDPGQRHGRVELDGLLEIAEMRVVRS
jgi:hypothetical protein